MRQRPGWTFPERWLPVADIARTRAFAPAPPWRLIAVALVLIALVLAALFVVGSQRKVAPPFGPARNGEIVYDSAGDLYVGNPDTDASRLLVGGPEVDSAPGWSPDGTRVAFFRDAGCCPQTVDIVAVKADGSGLSKVTTEPIVDDRLGQLGAGQQAPGRDRVGAEGSGGLELLDVDGREPPRRLAPDMDMGCRRVPPARRAGDRVPGDRQRQVRRVRDERRRDGHPPAPGAERPLDMGNHADNMVYSPDGQRLFYQSYDAGSGRPVSEGCCQLWVMNADGTDAHAFESVNQTAWTGVPTVSPDGRWVSYWSVLGDSGRQQIRVAPADGSGPADRRSGPR